VWSGGVVGAGLAGEMNRQGMKACLTETVRLRYLLLAYCLFYSVSVSECGKCQPCSVLLRFSLYDLRKLLNAGGDIFASDFCGGLLLLAVRPARRAFSFESSVGMGGECFLFNYFCGLQGLAQQDGKKDTMKTCVSLL